MNKELAKAVYSEGLATGVMLCRGGDQPDPATAAALVRAKLRPLLRAGPTDEPAWNDALHAVARELMGRGPEDPSPLEEP